MELIQSFGIDWTLFIAQIVNFLIILYVLKRFAYKPVLAMLKSREDAIKKGIKQAGDAAVLLEKTQEKEKQVLKKAQAEAKMLLEKAREENNKIIQEAREKGKKEMESMIEEAKKQIAFETKQAENKLTGHISEIAVMFLKKSLSEIVTNEDEQEIIQRSIKRLRTKRTN